jgi:hypothetical protein
MLFVYPSDEGQLVPGGRLPLLSAIVFPRPVIVPEIPLPRQYWYVSYRLARPFPPLRRPALCRS